MNHSQEQFEPATRAEWRIWLQSHAGSPGGVWLVLHKVHPRGDVPLSYEEAIDEAVAFGWIDSKAIRLDEQHYKLWIVPRKPGSGWSRRNKERVSRLIESGLMAEAGIAAVESPSTAAVPARLSAWSTYGFCTACCSMIRAKSFAPAPVRL